MLKQCINWIKQNTNPGEGVIIGSKRRQTYPEVTGYTIPTLLAAGERELAYQYANWLIGVQLPDGGFGGPGANGAVAFDTGQVMRGLVALLPEMPVLERPLMRACDWIIRTADEKARLLVPPGKTWEMQGGRGLMNEGIHLYCLPPLVEAGKLLNRTDYLVFARRSVDYYLSNVELTNFNRPNELTHLYGYIQEALVDLGCTDIAEKGMAAVEQFQQENGAVPAYSNVKWVCSTGLAQFGITWFKLGNRQRGELAINFLSQIQNPSGGFFGSYGPRADYFQDQEISWAAKFGADLIQCQIQSYFDEQVARFPTTIEQSDERFQTIVKAVTNPQTQKILDAGCGKGRFSNALKQLFPTAQITASDICTEMLGCVRPDIEAVEASILNMPFASNNFDVVFCVEALEHVVQVEQGLKELVRVLKPGGTLIVIDKNQEKLGALETPAWETWFGPEQLKSCLVNLGINCNVEFIGYNQRAADGLFVAWSGTKMAASNTRQDALQPESARGL